MITDRDKRDYVPILNACLQILSTIGIGAISGKCFPDTFDLHFMRCCVQFVFSVALPCLVTKGIGLGVDFYSNLYIWKYIAAFIILRVCSLLIAVFGFSIPRGEQNSETFIGKVAVRWLSLSWISTIILGIPVITAMTGDATRGQFYGILAGISSIIFQLPLQLYFFEWHKVMRDRYMRSSERTVRESALDRSIGNMSINIDQESARDEERSDNGSASRSTVIWKEVLLRIVVNPIVCAIFFGFVISITGFGSRYLLPLDNSGSPNEHYVKWLKFLVDVFSWFAGCVHPLSLFAMGIWMQNEGLDILRIGGFELCLIILLKFIAIPLIMVGLVNALSLGDEDGRAAILISTLPISMASFSLGKQYQIGESFLAANVAIGTILMLPAVIAWDFILYRIGFY